MDMEYILLEAFGYVGTALVIVSMMMTSVLKLRIINMCGGSISLIYAIIYNTWPIVVMNACIICINFYQTVRQLRRKDSLAHVTARADDASLLYFLDYHSKDIEKFFPSYKLTPHKSSEAHVIFARGEMVGVLIGTRAADVYRIEMDYVIPKYRGIATGDFLFPRLREQGVNMLTAPSIEGEHDRYLKTLGFAKESGIMLKVFN